MLSLGNIGSVKMACGEANLAVESILGLNLACSYGTLGELKNLGLSKTQNSNCDAKDFLMEECNMASNLFAEGQKYNLVEFYDEFCYG